MADEILSCIRECVAEYGRDHGVDVSSWLVRATDTECAVCGLASRSDAEQLAELLKARCAAAPTLMGPRTYAPHWCVISVLTPVAHATVGTEGLRHRDRGG
jgi:hypothetical protein